ncbi:uncharacterized protein GrlHz isoform X2 [Anabrus simplex]|uniref:uncharacterized protein GrlHz isoform X2 n=1 Tax=Anabrus simplex TaxID=316456 RepID=UPI0034DD5FD2
MAETEENGDNRTLQRSPAPSSTSSSSIDINSIDMIAEITEDTPHESLSTSAVLYYCKRKILHPYLRLLSVMGLRSSTQDIPGSRRCMTILSYVYLVEVTFLLCAGYVLQSLSCFRRDRGFCYKKQPKHLSFTDKYEQICYGSLPFTYIIPSVLHLSAYLYAVYLFRCKENEQLQNLMERVFLLSSSHSDGPLRQRQLVRKLWLFIGLSIVWMVFSLVSINVMMADGNIIFHWFENSSAKWKVFLKVLLVISTLCHDMAQTILITSYCLQGQLLRSYLHFLGAKMLQHSMLPLDWLRAARLTNACRAICHLGHEVRVRPFVYKDTPGEDLDSILLYTSSLRLSCKLFDVPITGRYLCVILTLSAISLLILGQCHVLQEKIN